jgi:hypothetical protein
MMARGYILAGISNLPGEYLAVFMAFCASTSLGNHLSLTFNGGPILNRSRQGIVRNVMADGVDVAKL